MRSPRLRLLGVALAPMIFLAACGDSQDGGTSDDSTMTSAPDDAAATSMAPNGDIDEVAVQREDRDGVEVPTLELGAQPFVVADTEVRVLEEGDGEEITAEQDVELRYTAVNGTSGEEIVSTFPTDETVWMELANPYLLPGFAQVLPGTRAGQELLVAMPPAQAFGEAGNAQLGVEPADTLVFYVEVVGAETPLTQAEGEEVEPEEGLPTVEADGTSPAQITIPEGEDAPEELVVQPLIEGEGPEVEEGQMISVHYTGVTWSEGEQFDSSLTEDRGAPADFPIGTGGVIPGWDEGLVGQTVGSRVLLVIPPGQAYGEDPEAHELGGETLVFVVDILKAR